MRDHVRMSLLILVSTRKMATFYKRPCPNVCIDLVSTKKMVTFYERPCPNVCIDLVSTKKW